MLLRTSIRNAKKIADRLRKLGGIVGTPEADYVAIKVKRAWIFGSTVKGKANPNDTDILIEFVNVGEQRDEEKKQCKRNPSWWKSEGISFPLRAEHSANRSLSKGMRNISIHNFRVDGSYEDIPATKVMIYPKWELSV